jgi:hypothetical protein
MTDATYTVEPDPRGVTTLWRHEVPDNELPIPLDESHDEMFLAAAAVLAPSDEVRELVAQAIWQAQAKPDGKSWQIFKAGYLKRADNVLAELKAYATGGGADA